MLFRRKQETKNTPYLVVLNYLSKIINKEILMVWSETNSTDS